MKIAIFGANGATGRLLARQSLEAGHEVAAITRRPADYPFQSAGLEVVGADVYDAEAVIGATQGCDAVLSTLGVPFTRSSVTIYSSGVNNVIAAMQRHDMKRIAVVSSSATYPHDHADGGFLLNRVMQPLITATIGRTTYDDMRRMEELIRASDLNWTVVRPSGLFDLAEITDYRLDENEAPGAFTARIDLAASMLAQLTDERFVRKNVAVTTTAVKPNILRLIFKEAFKKA
jgi:uncharacterized protein YbjT (DUF2867 family)